MHKSMIWLAFLVVLFQCNQKPVELFDGKTFTGWEGDTAGMWRIEDAAIVGGSLSKMVPLNDFLCTRDTFSDFVLKLKFKLIAKEGFVNAGIQFRSRRLKDPAYEMTGYQADLGPGYWGSLYDESRRNKTLAAPDSATVLTRLRPDDWNDYEVRADGNRIQLFINGYQTVDYHEQDKAIPQSGVIGLQIHGGGKAQVSYKDIFISRNL